MSVSAKKRKFLARKIEQFARAQSLTIEMVRSMRGLGLVVGKRVLVFQPGVNREQAIAAHKVVMRAKPGKGFEIATKQNPLLKDIQEIEVLLEEHNRTRPYRI